MGFIRGPPRLIFPWPSKKPISNQLSGLYIYRNRGVRVHSPPSLSSRAPHPLSHALPPSPHPTVPCLLSGPSSLLSPTLPCLPLNLPHQQPIWRSSRARRSSGGAGAGPAEVAAPAPPGSSTGGAGSFTVVPLCTATDRSSSPAQFATVAPPLPNCSRL